MEERKVVDLRFGVGVINYRPLYSTSLTIMMPSYADRGVFVPAASVTIPDESGILALRDALNEAFPLSS